MSSVIRFSKESIEDIFNKAIDQLKWAFSNYIQRESPNKSLWWKRCEFWNKEIKDLSQLMLIAESEEEIEAESRAA